MPDRSDSFLPGTPMLYRYLLILIACSAILIGMQVPSFVDQYAQRLDAHLIEVTENLRGFQEIADRHHGGSLEALVREHEGSTSVTFREEAVPLRAMYLRRQTFLSEQRRLDAHLARQAVHVFFNGHPELIRETQAQYAYTVPLTERALVAGGVFAAGVLLLTELLAKMLSLFFRRRRRSYSGEF